MIESVLMDGAVETASTLASWLPMQKFYLSDGTALALQKGHRRSKDFDFFTLHSLEVLPELPQLDNLLKRFRRVEWIHKSEVCCKVVYGPLQKRLRTQFGFGC